MALHRLTRLVMGVPNVAETAAFYKEYGLDEVSPGRFRTADGGEQLEITQAPLRHALEIGVGCDDEDDLARIESNLRGLDIDVASEEGARIATDPGTGTRVRVEIAAPLKQEPAVVDPLNVPGRYERLNARAPTVLREGPVRPSKLAHVVIASPDRVASQRFFIDGIGFKVSDRVGGDLLAFMRCSNDHHNVLIQPGPVPYLHHTAWEVASLDEVGRGAERMKERYEGCAAWGIGRHYLGSNYYYYLRDPAGNFAEYTSDVDSIADDAEWTPGDWELGKLALYAWGPPAPPEFINPPDIAEQVASGA